MIFVRRRRKALIWPERKEKLEKNVDVVNLTRNSRLCSLYFDKEEISTDGYMGGNPVRMSMSAAPLHVMFRLYLNPQQLYGHV